MNSAQHKVRMHRNILLICALSLLACSCNKTGRGVKRAFYHWQTELNLSSAEESYLEALGVNTLYVKFFDVDWDGSQKQALPLAPVRINPEKLGGITVIPTVFITNRSLLNVKEEEIPALAISIHDKIFRLSAQIPGHNLTEIQMDCDWTGKTRDKYFGLLTTLKNELKERNIRLSATIRLHQVKYYKKTGIPPVDKGMLMFYNTGQLDVWEEKNSILQMETAGPYLSGLKRYPLQLDIVLPIFAWGVLFRDGKMIRLINNLKEAELLDGERFHKIDSNRFQLLKSTYLNGRYLYKGDKIRTEAGSLELLQDATAMLVEKLRNQALTVAFYHLDTATIKHFPHEKLEEVYRQFEIH